MLHALGLLWWSTASTVFGSLLCTCYLKGTIDIHWQHIDNATLFVQDHLWQEASWHLAQEAGGECFAPKKELSWKSWKEMLGAVSTCGKATRYLDSRSIHPLKRNLGIEPRLKIYSSGVLWYWLLPSHLEISEKFHYVTMFSAHHSRFKSRTSLCSGRPVRPDTWLKLGHWIKESPAFVEWWGQSGQEWTNCQLRAWTRTLVHVFFCMLED